MRGPLPVSRPVSVRHQPPHPPWRRLRRVPVSDQRARPKRRARARRPEGVPVLGDLPVQAVIRCVVASCAASLWCAAAASLARAAPASTFAISIHVTDERVPDHLCVLTNIRCKQRGEPCRGTAALGSILPLLRRVTD